MLMSDSARQPAVEMFVIVAPPSTSPEENPRVQCNSTRRAFRTFRSFSTLMLRRQPLCERYPSVVVLTPWVMSMGLRGGWRHKLLSRQDDMARFTLLGQMFCNFRMVGSDIADQPPKEPL